MITLSPKQDAVITDVDAWLREPFGPQWRYLAGYAGTGKTTLAKKLAESRRVKFCAFTGKAASVLREKGCADATTLHRLIYRPEEKAVRAADGEQRWSTEFVARDDNPLFDCDLVVLDECFVAGTMVDTSTGPRPIEQLQVDDLILNAGGIDAVKRTMRRKVEQLAQVDFGGTTLTCSPDHPFFTRGGIHRARELKAGDELALTGATVRLLRNTIRAQIRSAAPILLNPLQHELVAAATEFSLAHLYRGAGSKVWLGEEAFLGGRIARGQGTDRANSAAKPVNATRGAGQDIRSSESYGPSAAGTRWERSGTDEASAAAASCAGAVVDYGTQDHNEHTCAADSSLLQNRSGTSRKIDRDRGGWGQSLRKASPSKGFQEEHIPDFVRVDRAEVLEPGDPRVDQYRNAEGTYDLYDLEAAGHSSFSVAGVLVHNCSMVNSRMAIDLMSYGKKILVLGDPFQLPPTSGEGYFVKETPNWILTDVHRQAAESGILRLATDIREGRGTLNPADYLPDCALVSLEEATEREDELLRWCDVVLTGTHRFRRYFNEKYRAAKNFRGPYPEAGDQLVCLANDHKKGLLNGALWECEVDARQTGHMRLDVFMRSVDDPKVKLLADCWAHDFLGLEDDLQKLPWARRNEHARFTYGYALTVHKSQGSEFERVLLVDESSSFREHSAQWLYTGVTRASKQLVVVQR